MDGMTERGERERTREGGRERGREEGEREREGVSKERERESRKRANHFGYHGNKERHISSGGPPGALWVNI